ncbi:MAG: flagellar biosynthetic protein FliR [Firmicutes bacterium]|nr:flagellar biosynthetic protein FliR [Dethiobacter sp.]MBS3888651.1 flagellar biosynthetic protein FliR [Bacillota bacterium]
MTVMAPWLTFLLILGRIMSMLVTAPLFGRRDIPLMPKLGLGMYMSLLTMTTVETSFSGSNAAFIQAFLAEVVGGLVVGLLASWLLSSFAMGGQLMDQQAGFGTASVLDPGTATTVTLIGNLLLYVGLLLFLELNGHHLLIMGLMRSFAVVPAGNLGLPLSLTEWAVRTLTISTVLFLRLAMPLLAVIVITDIALGMIGRAVPQLNVLMLGLPLKAGVALLLLGVLSPLFLAIGHEVVMQVENSMGLLLGGMVR